MGSFTRRGQQVLVSLDEYELELLPTLLAELSEVLDDGRGRPEADPDDPFSAWESDFSTEEGLDDPDFLEPDPITRRLFPDAYVDDPAASHDFRRFTHAQARREKLDAIAIVLADLESLRPSGRTTIDSSHLQAWMTTINTLRIVLAVVLGITDEVSADEAARRPDSDAKGVIHHYYAWLGWMLESLMEAVAAR